MQRRLSYLLIWTSFYEQVAWVPVLVLLATAVGDPGAVALAASAYSLANLGGNLLFGHAADRFSRYTVAGMGLIGMAVTAVLHLLAPSPGALVGARFLHGMAAAAVAPAAFAVVSQAVPHERRGQVMARVGLLIALASMLAPTLTGRIAKSLGPVPAIAVLAGWLGVVGLVAVAAGRSEGAPARPAAPPGIAGGSGPDRLDPGLAVSAAVVAFVLMFGQNVLFYALPLRGAELGLDPARVGALLSAFALGAFVAFVPPLSRAADRWGRQRPMLVGLCLAAGGLLALSRAAASPAMAAALFCYGLGFGLVFPAVSALSSDAAGQGRRGLSFGLLTAAFSAGSICGPLLTRALDGRYPPFAVAAVVAFAGALAVLVWPVTVGVGKPPASVR